MRGKAFVFLVTGKGHLSWGNMVSVRAVLAALGRGRASAKTQSVLAAETGIEARCLRDMINHLIIGHGKMIGSAPGKPAGYFMIATLEELEDACRSLRHHAIMMLVRMSKLKQKSIEEIYQQEVLPELGKGGIN